MKREELKSYIPNEVYWDLEAMHSDGKFLEDGVELYIKSEADSVMDALEAKIKSLEADIEESNSVQLEHLTSANELISSLEEENKSLRFNLEDWKHKAEEMELTAKSFDAEIARSHEKIKETESKYNQLCWQHDALEDECNKADERIQKLTNENADLVMEVEKLQERIKEREAVVSEMETSQPKWISVEERFPTTDEYDEVLVDLHEVSDYPIAGVERIRTFQFITDSIEYDADNNCGIFNVEGMEKCWFTKWMPLPYAPKSED